MTSSLQVLKSVAASGTATVIVPVADPAQGTQVSVNVQYDAVAGTSGVTGVVTVSRDGGSTYGASNVPFAKIAPAATEVGSNLLQALQASCSPVAADAGNITHIKVVLTNTDATNAFVLAVLAETVN